MITRRSLAAAAGALGLLPRGRAALAQSMELAAGPAEYLFFVFSDPVPGQEAAYASWFADPGRARRMLAIPGVVRAEHLEPGPELRHAPMPTPHDLLLYRISTAQPRAVADALARHGAGDAWPGPTIATVRTATFRALAGPVNGAGGEPPGAKPGPPARYTVLAFHNVVDGQDRAFNTWYDGIHLPELLAKPGVVSGQRAIRSPIQFGPDNTAPRYAMVLGIATGDLPAVFEGILHGGPPSPAIDRARSYGFTYRAVD